VFLPTTKVLIVDDMKTMRKIVMKSLRDLGLTDFKEAGDGAEAWSVLSDPASQIQLIVSDWNMPNCSGLDLLKRVRADSKLKGLPFLLLTAESEAAQVTEALKAGVDNYLVKPFSTDSLGQKLTQIYKRKNAA
jgi:two-component system chemotaxis response regulator CheY